MALASASTNLVSLDTNAEQPHLRAPLALAQRQIGQLGPSALGLDCRTSKGCALATALVAAAGCAPQSEPGIELLGVSPRRISTLEEQPATVSGNNFRNAVTVDLDSPSAPMVSRGWRFTI